MKNLIPIAGAFSHFEKIVSSKNKPHKGTLNTLRTEIKKSYNNYKAKASKRLWEEIKSKNFRGDKKDALLHCYNSKTAALGLLKAEIKETQDDIGKCKCQYCTVRTPETFDHYLPKEDFCEYSVLSYNLIPCCNSCNELKGGDWFNHDGRMFVNLYYDEITQYRFLYCSISYDKDIPVVEFQIRKNTNISDDEFQLIKTHYKKLKLLELFKKHSNSEIAETKRILQVYSKKKNLDLVREELKEESKQTKRQYGNNYWKAILKDALANNDTFLNSLRILKHPKLIKK